MHTEPCCHCSHSALTGLADRKLMACLSCCNMMWPTSAAGRTCGTQLACNAQGAHVRRSGRTGLLLAGAMHDLVARRAGCTGFPEAGGGERLHEGHAFILKLQQMWCDTPGGTTMREHNLAPDAWPMQPGMLRVWHDPSHAAPPCHSTARCTM